MPDALDPPLESPDPPLTARQQTAIAELLALDDTALVDRLHVVPQDTEEEAEEQQERKNDLESAYAANSKRTARADWRTWCRFCDAAGLPRLPATVRSLRRFLKARIAAGKRRATLDHYLWTLALVHRLNELPWPLDTGPGRRMWKGQRRRLAKGQHQKHGLTLDEVEQMIAAMKDAPSDLRDAALLSVASEVLARPSEAVSLAFEQLTFNATGSGRVFFPKSKADQEGKGAVLAISAECVERLRRWVAHAEVTTGPVFRAIPLVVFKKEKRVPLPGRYGFALNTRDVQRIYKRRAAAAGLDPINISGHSPRIGSAQDMGAANLSGPLIQQQGRWKSPRMVNRYLENLQADRGAMPQLLAMRAARKRAE
jgi:integrase